MRHLPFTCLRERPQGCLRCHPSRKEGLIGAHRGKIVCHPTHVNKDGFADCTWWTAGLRGRLHKVVPLNTWLVVMTGETGCMVLIYLHVLDSAVVVPAPSPEGFTQGFAGLQEAP